MHAAQFQVVVHNVAYQQTELIAFAARFRLGLKEPQRRGDERRDRHAPQLEREHARVDPCQLEQIVDERRERAYLSPQDREVVVRGLLSGTVTVVPPVAVPSFTPPGFLITVTVAPGATP